MFDVWSGEFVLSVWTEGKDINGAERRHRVSSSFFSRTPATFPTMASLMGQTIRLSGGVDTRVLNEEVRVRHERFGRGYMEKMEVRGLDSASPLRSLPTISGHVSLSTEEWC